MNGFPSQQVVNMAGDNMHPRGVCNQVLLASIRCILIHLAALERFTIDEIISNVSEDDMAKRRYACMMLGEIADRDIDGNYHLKFHLWEEVDPNCPGFTKKALTKVRRNRKRAMDGILMDVAKYNVSQQEAVADEVKHTRQHKNTVIMNETTTERTSKRLCRILPNTVKFTKEKVKSWAGKCKRVIRNYDSNKTEKRSMKNAQRYTGTKEDKWTQKDLQHYMQTGERRR